MRLFCQNNMYIPAFFLDNSSNGQIGFLLYFLNTLSIRHFKILEYLRFNMFLNAGCCSIFT